MDTVFLQSQNFKKTATNAGGIIIVISLLLATTANLFAKDFSSGSYTGFSPALDLLIRNQLKLEQSFNQNLNYKYAGSKIYEVDKGIKHVQMIKFYNNRPVRINVVELSTNVNSNLEIEPAIASTSLASKERISNIAQREGAIVAINGGYFKPQTGVPLGTLMINRKIYTGPIYDRVALGIFENKYEMARVKLKALVKTNIGDFKIDNVNQPRMLSTHAIVYTRDWGEISPPSPKYGAQLVVSNGKLVKITTNSVEIPENGFVVIAPTKKLGAITKAKKFKLDLQINPEWEKVVHVIGGGPYLVRNGEIFVDMTAQKLSAIGGRNPRTAIGYTKNNHLIMLTADGREGASIGLTLMELAQLMKEFGCVNAMNLDGGGSTVMYVDGHIVNKPAIKGGIPLSNTIMVSLKNNQLISLKNKRQIH